MLHVFFVAIRVRKLLDIMKRGYKNYANANPHARYEMKQNTSNLSVHGAWEVKRHFTLPAMTDGRDAQLVTNRIGQLPGVRGACADIGRHRVTVVYDTTQLYYRQVLDALAATGFPVPETWWSRLKTGWLQNLDETGRGNANAPAAPCCSNPKGIAPNKSH